MSIVSRRNRMLLCPLLAGWLLVDCGGGKSTLQPTPLVPTTLSLSSLNLSDASAESAPVGVLAGAGDIAVCGSQGAFMTAALLDGISGTVFTAGDNAYFRGSAKDFRNCYEPTWGRHKARTRPSPGNHDYESGGSAYFDYFGSNAGPAGLGYYSYAIGSWRVLSLNSEAPSGPGSPQGEWLRGELSAKRSACTAAYWHRPLFSSGRIGDNPDMRDLWRTLYDAGVDLIINGHDHLYERFAPQDPDGRADPVRGIREFIIGTGGAALSGTTRVHANSEVRESVWGIAVFMLFEHSYRWQFLPVSDGVPEDTGTTSCH